MHYHKDDCSYDHGDFPLRDILVGTFPNPPEYRGEYGVENDVDCRLFALLALVDVKGDAFGTSNRGQRPGTREPASSQAN